MTRENRRGELAEPDVFQRCTCEGVAVEGGRAQLLMLLKGKVLPTGILVDRPGVHFRNPHDHITHHRLKVWKCHLFHRLSKWVCDSNPGTQEAEIGR